MALKTVFSLLNIRWPLSSEDTGNVNSVSGRRTNTVEMRDKPSVNGGIGEVSFHHTKLALSIALPSVKLNSLALYHLELTLMRPIPIDVSNNTRVLEVYNGIVDEELGGGRGVEDIKVIIFDPGAVEIGRGVCLHMKGDGVLGVSPFANSYNMSINPNLSEGNISCYFILTVLVEEDKGVLLHITTVILAPPVSWMVQVIKLLSELGNIGDGARHRRKGNGGVIHSKSDWLITLNIVVQHISFNFVKDLRDEEEVLNGGVVTKGGSEDLVVKLSIP